MFIEGATPTLAGGGGGVRACAGRRGAAPSHAASHARWRPWHPRAPNHIVLSQQYVQATAMSGQAGCGAAPSSDEEGRREFKLLKILFLLYLNCAAMFLSFCSQVLRSFLVIVFSVCVLVKLKLSVNSQFF